MTDPNSVRVGVTCDCGEKYHVGIAGIELETLKHSCPKCGVINAFTDDDIAKIAASHSALAEKARKLLR